MPFSSNPDRRTILAGGFSLLGSSMVSACSSTNPDTRTFAVHSTQQAEPAQFNYAAIYGPRFDNEIELPAFDTAKMNDRFLRQWVRYSRNYKPGTVVVDNTGPYLYLVHPGKRALRYGTAVGREGYAWHGDAVMRWKQKWPTWTPPREMIERSPKLAEYEDGMPAGVENPLGARAMYLYKDGKDTLFRIHGTNRPYSIGKRASSGCFRMINHDVIDLYERVTPGAQVVVLPADDTQELNSV